MKTVTQQRNLYYDTVMGEAIDERIWYTLCHLLPVIVVCLAIYINHRFLYVSNTVPKEIDGNHRYGMTRWVIILTNILGIGIVRTQILAETKRFRFHPCLLQLYEHQLLPAIILTDGGGKVYAEHGDSLPAAVGVFMPAHLNSYYRLLQQRGKHGTSHALILHEVLEHRVVYRVCYV